MSPDGPANAESVPERKRRLSKQNFVVDTTPYKTFSQDQARARRRSNTGKTNLQQQPATSDTNEGGGGRRGSAALAESAVRATALRRASHDQERKQRKSSNRVNFRTPPDSSRSSSGSTNGSQKGGRSSGNQVTSKAPESKEKGHEFRKEQFSWSSGMREAAELPIMELSNEERTQWSVPSTKSNVPLRTMLLDREANTIPKHKSYNKLRDARRRVNVAHESYDIDGDGVVGPEDMELARRVDLMGRGELSTKELTEARAKLAARFFMENEERLWQYGEPFVEKSLRENVAQLCEGPTEPGKSRNAKVFANAYQDLSTKYRGLRSKSSDGMQECISGIESDKDDGLTYLPTQPPLLINDEPAEFADDTEHDSREETQGSVAKVASAALSGRKVRQKLFSNTHKRLFGDDSDTRPTLYERHRRHLAKTRGAAPTAGGNQESEKPSAAAAAAVISSSQSAATLGGGCGSTGVNNNNNSSSRGTGNSGDSGEGKPKQAMRRCKTRSELRQVRQRERLEESHVLYGLYSANQPQYDNKKIGLVDFHISPPEKQHRGLDRILQQQWALTKGSEE